MVKASGPVVERVKTPLPFWITNHVANRFLKPLLRGPLGRRLGRRLAMLRYHGRRTGQTRELVVQYVRDGDVVWIVPGQPDRKQWWRNMRDARPVELWLAGVRVAGVAHVVTGADRQEMADGLAGYRTVFRRVTQPTVMVRVDLLRSPEVGTGVT